MLSVHESIKISYSHHIRCQQRREYKGLSNRFQWLVVLVVTGCWYTCSVAFPILPIDIENLPRLSKLYRWLSPVNCHKLPNNVPYLTNVRPESGCSEEWAIIGIPTIRCISEQLGVITCNKHCCEAFIQMKWVLFPIAMNRSSGYNPIGCPAISAKLRCIEIPCQVKKVARRACARISDVAIPWFDLPNSQSELASAELFGLLT